MGETVFFQSSWKHGQHTSLLERQGVNKEFETDMHPKSKG